MIWDHLYKTFFFKSSTASMKHTPPSTDHQQSKIKHLGESILSFPDKSTKFGVKLLTEKIPEQLASSVHKLAKIWRPPQPAKEKTTNTSGCTSTKRKSISGRQYTTGHFAWLNTSSRSRVYIIHFVLSPSFRTTGFWSLYFFNFLIFLIFLIV